MSGTLMSDRKFTGKAVVGIVAAVLVGVASKAFFASDLSPFASLGKPTIAQLEAEIVDSSELFVVMSDLFPEEFAALIEEISALDNKDDATVQALTAQRTAELRQRYRDTLLAATDEKLRELMTAMARTHRVVLEQLGHETCGRFAMQGPQALGDNITQNPLVFGALENQGLAMFKAMGSGIDGQPRSMATNDDYTAALNYADLSADDQASANLVARSAIDEPAYCEALAWYFDSLAGADGEAGERVRATFAVQLAAS